MASSRAGSFEEWLAIVEDKEAEKQEMERERKEAAVAAKARKQAASEGRFDTWVHTKMHQTKAIKVRPGMIREGALVSSLRLTTETANMPSARYSRGCTLACA
jgi:hypothetical protein